MKSKSKLLRWVDRGREPKAEPDKRFPDGIDVDLTGGALRTCLVQLGYPAERVGYYLIQCACGANACVTTAGRADDPRSVKIACKGH